MTRVATMSRYLLCRSKLLSSHLCKNGHLLKRAAVSGNDATSSSLLRSYSRCVSQSNAASVRQRCYPGAANRRWFTDTLSEEYNQENVRVDEESEEIKSDLILPNQKASEPFSLDVLVSLLRQENAMDICVIKVPEEINYAQHFIVVSGVSPRHLSAMSQYANKVYKHLKKDHESHVKIEGKNADDWLCIDFGSIVVHFMLPETREAYELEKLWTLRSYDEQLQKIPDEKLPEDFTYDLHDSQI